MESSRVPGSPAGRHARPTGNGGIRMRSSVGGVGVACLLVSIAGLPAGALARCDDPAAVCAARAVADAQCNCATATTHGQYVKCVSQAAQGEVNAARLPRGCKANVVRCASRSTCGKPGFVTCCRTDVGGVTCPGGSAGGAFVACNPDCTLDCSHCPGGVCEVTCEPIVAGQPIPNTYQLLGVPGPKICITNSSSNALQPCNSDADCGGQSGSCLQTPWVTADGFAFQFPTGIKTTFTVAAADSPP